MVHGDPTRGEVPAIVERRPANTGPSRRSERMRSSRRPDPAVCALEERSLATPRPLSADGRCLPKKTERGEAEPTRSGGVVRWAERQRRTLASEDAVLPTGGGDRQIADCSAANLGTATSKELSASICVICGFFRWVGGRPSCLRVFVFAIFCSVFFSVSLCLCASVVIFAVSNAC